MKFYVSTCYDNQIPVISKDGFAGGRTIEEETLAINQQQISMSEFRRKYDAITRRKAICNFLHPDASFWWSDLTASQWEARLKEELSK